MELDAAQFRAATTTDRRALVASVPGSGKTRTICARFEHMVKSMHILPRQIALLTFTRHAAGEMRERIGDSCGPAFIGTLHSFALRIIREYGRDRGWEPAWLSVLDQAEVEAEEFAALIACGGRNLKGDWKVRAGEWRRYCDAQQNGEEFHPEQHEAVYAAAWRAFMDRLRSENALTFGTIILEASALLETPGLGDEIRQRWRHVLLDECQDTDSRQWGLIRLLNPETLFAVGDVDQSIFAWRGGRPDLFLAYAAEPETACYELPNSYRFGFNIASPANRLIKNNQDRIDIAINAIGKNEGTVRVLRDTPYAKVAEIIKTEIQAGRQPHEIAVLARRHDTLERTTAFLKAADVPHFYTGGQTAVPKTAEFRAVRGYMRLAVNPRDNRAFMAISISENLSQADLWTLREKALKERVSLSEAHGIEMPKTFEDIRAWLVNHHQYDPAVEYIAAVREREGLYELQDIINYLAMEAEQDKLKDKEGRVAVTTIHAAKGLEWPVVLLIGMNSEVFPSRRSVKEGKMQEERRLAYVAMTRAETSLYLVNLERDTDRDAESVFLVEAGVMGLTGPVGAGAARLLGVGLPDAQPHAEAIADSVQADVGPGGAE